MQLSKGETPDDLPPTKSNVPSTVVQTGKMFRTSDLYMVTEFFLMFHKDKPVDWLLDHILWVKTCNPEKDAVSQEYSDRMVYTTFYILFVKNVRHNWKTTFLLTRDMY